jgi:hypothetical protein
MKLWRLLMWHNLHCWRRNIRGIIGSALTVCFTLFAIQMFLGFTAFYAAVADAIAHAKVLKIDITGSYVIDGLDSTYSSWLPGHQLVITSQSRDLLNIVQIIVKSILGSISILFFIKEVFGSYNLASLELEARVDKYNKILKGTLDPAVVRKLALGQRLMIQGLSIGLGLVLSTFLVVPVMAMLLDRAMPGVGSFFQVRLLDLPFLCAPLLILTLLGLVFTRRGVARMIERF